MKRYFSSESGHGSETSYGFSNDTIVLCFDSKKSRDNYVKNSRNISCKAVKFSSVTKAAANWDMTSNKMIKPSPFTSEYWGIVKLEHSIPGCIGEVAICGYWFDGDKLYR